MRNLVCEKLRLWSLGLCVKLSLGQSLISCLGPTVPYSIGNLIYKVEVVVPVSKALVRMKCSYAYKALSLMFGDYVDLCAHQTQAESSAFFMFV